MTHRIVLTMAMTADRKRNANWGLRMRCACMEDVRHRDSNGNFYAYDWIADGVTLGQAKYAFEEHVRTGTTLVKL